MMIMIVHGPWPWPWPQLFLEFSFRRNHSPYLGFLPHRSPGRYHDPHPGHVACAWRWWLFMSMKGRHLRANTITPVRVMGCDERKIQRHGLCFRRKEIQRTTTISPTCFFPKPIFFQNRFLQNRFSPKPIFPKIGFSKSVFLPNQFFPNQFFPTRFFKGVFSKNGFPKSFFAKIGLTLKLSWSTNNDLPLLTDYSLVLSTWKGTFICRPFMLYRERNIGQPGRVPVGQCASLGYHERHIGQPRSAHWPTGTFPGWPMFLSRLSMKGRQIHVPFQVDRTIHGLWHHSRMTEPITVNGTVFPKNSVPKNSFPEKQFSKKQSCKNSFPTIFSKTIIFPKTVWSMVVFPSRFSPKICFSLKLVFP